MQRLHSILISIPEIWEEAVREIDLQKLHKSRRKFIRLLLKEEYAGMRWVGWPELGFWKRYGLLEGLKESGCGCLKSRFYFLGLKSPVIFKIVF